MNHPDNLKYTAEDWWLRPEGDGLVALGITAWKGEELGEIVMAELPQAGEPVRQSQEVGVLEVLKTTFDLHAPLAGTVEAVNQAVLDQPSLINEHPFGEGWLLRLRPEDAGALEAMLSREQYVALRRIEE